MRFPPGNPPKRAAFTLLEMLTAFAVFTVVIVLLLSILGQASGIWRRSSSHIEAFQSARLAFDLMTRNLSQATLNAYLDYDNATNPRRYLRKSDLAFVSGPAGAAGLPGTAGTGQAVFFQAPLSYETNLVGLDMLLNTCGYYVSFTTNGSYPPHVTAPNPYRYRLMQMLVPAESNAIYSATNGAWFAGHAAEAQAVADNVIALIIRPQDPEASPADLAAPGDYAYDSTLSATNDPQPATAHQLPPVLKVTLLAIDESSARRLEDGATPPSAIADALGGKFSVAANFDRDLEDVRKALAAAKINYRVFSTAIPLRESKWTR